MKIVTWNTLSVDEKKEILSRATTTTHNNKVLAVESIVKKVKESGDEALYELTFQFDNLKLDHIEVDKNLMKKAFDSLTKQERLNFQQAYDNIKSFHQCEELKSFAHEVAPGIDLWKKEVPLTSVGLYVPGGTAPLFSSLLMMAIPAKVAGCKNIVVATPPSKHGINKYLLAACYLCEIDKLYQVGGAQAVAAMAFGTQTVQKVDKIFGPGNSYVSLAKQICSVDVSGAALDMPAGPSEVMVVADENANAKFIASDLLSQAEHGPDSQVMAIVKTDEQAKEISFEFENLSNKLNRVDIIKKSRKFARIIILDSESETLNIINEYAPEHLILNLDNPDYYIDNVVNAGSVFVGRWSPESVGDYASGTNHVLPTNGYARAYSGLGTKSFSKTITYQKLTKEGLATIADTVMWMSEIEGLHAHRLAVDIRMNEGNYND